MTKYKIEWGNRKYSIDVEEKDLKRKWRTAIHKSQYMMYGDVYLICNETDKHIRSMHNADIRTLDKSQLPFKYFVVKSNTKNHDK